MVMYVHNSYNLIFIMVFVLDISQEMAINSYDIVSTLQALGMMKYWKGKHIILKKQVLLAIFHSCNLDYSTHKSSKKVKKVGYK